MNLFALMNLKRLLRSKKSKWRLCYNISCREFLVSIMGMKTEWKAISILFAENVLIGITLTKI